MNKKIILIPLISLGIFMAGCGNKKVIRPASDAISLEASTKPQASIDTKDDTKDTIKESTVPEEDNSKKENSKSSEDPAYELIKKVYTDKNVTVNYPQLTNLGDKDKQNKINELIKAEALADFSDGTDENMDLKLDYAIRLQNEDILSIQYSGVGYYKGAAHPGNWFYTTNIDMNSGKKIKLSDLININEDFVVKFKKEKRIDGELSDDSQSNKELQSVVIEYVDNIDTDKLMTYFKQSDSRGIRENPSNTYSYLTKDSIGISISVPHALGDHAEFQIYYR